LLIIDQFEELFTLSTERERRRFLDNLVTAITDPRSRVRVVLTLRADFYDRPLLSPGFASVFASSVVNVLPLSPAELEAAIVDPAAAVGVSVEPALLAQLIADVGRETQVLPLLEFTLTELFGRNQGGTLYVSDYQAVGGLEGALTSGADHLFKTLDSTGQETIKSLLLHLVRADRGSDPTLRRVPLDDLRQLGEVDEVLATFISNRLLTADRDVLTGEATIQVTHEALLEGWGRLRSWIEEHLTDLQRRSALSAAAAEWKASGNDPDYLLTGGRLAQLNEWSQETPMALAAQEREFLRRSLDRQAALENEDEVRRQREVRVTRRAKRRLWALAAVVALFAATVTYSVLAMSPKPLPPIAYMSDAFENTSYSDSLSAGFDLAVSEFGEDAVGAFATSWWDAHDEINRLAGAGVKDFVVTAPVVGRGMDEIASGLPHNRFAVLDSSGDQPNVQYVNFAGHEGSFLVGAVAALRSQSNIIGFVGGQPYPVTLSLQAGFEAGARYVRPDVELLVEYLTPEPDIGGFGSMAFAQAKTEPLYRAGADVIFHAVGFAGRGVFEAARVESVRQGRQLWAIGADTDEYSTVLNESLTEFGGPDPRTSQPHVLTSMIKRWDVAVHTVINDFATDQFRPGTRVLRLADGGVGYSTSGGFIDDLVPTIEDLKARIIAGEIVVPEAPSA
jgi:basic membrane lipoprotein Med (substrate-binding protein (PBP1-ABC) superfamily)